MTSADNVDVDVVTRELADLGEAEASSQELAWIRDSHDHEGADDPMATVASVATLVAIGHHGDATPALSEFERHRVWREVARRAAPIHRQYREHHAHPAGIHEHHGDHGEPAPVRGPGVWRTVVAAAAVAAGLAILPQLAGGGLGGPASPAELESTREMGQLARDGLSALEGPEGSARTEDLAKAYAARLAAQRSDDTADGPKAGEPAR